MQPAAEAAIAAFPLERPLLSPLPGGLINTTFLVEAAQGRFVLQRLHPIFAAEVNEDIDAVTTHLAAKGLVTPRVVRTREGALSVRHDGGVWRVLTFIEGETLHRVDSAARAEAAGELVGRFHAALADLRHEFRFRRAGVHDTAGHAARLDEALLVHAVHPHAAEVARLRDLIRAGLTGLPALTSPPLARHVAHGDLKISNLLFAPDGRGVCLVDLDTLGEMILPHELGDALRSWCNPLGEDTEEPRFERTYYDAARRGYQAAVPASLVGADEQALVPAGMLTICLELAARFACDVLEDQYFGWDTTRFPSRAAHNLVRARGQAALYTQAAQSLA